MNNHIYDLIKALGEKAEAIQVYEQYEKDAANCQKCVDLWKRLKGQDQKDIEEMKQMLVEHVKNGEL